MRAHAVSFGIIVGMLGTGLVTQACSSSNGGSSGLVADAGGADAPVDAATAPEVRVSFAARVGSKPFDCATTYDNLGTPARSASPLTFALYVHDVRLLTKDGAEVPLTLTQDDTWQYKNLALLDFENRTGSCSNGTTETNDAVVGTLPAGTGTSFTGVAFKVGVPADINHENVATQPSPLNLSSMFWDWQGGYKFMRIDFLAGSGGDAGVPSATLLHLGSTACSGQGNAVTCAKLNTPEVKLVGNFVPGSTRVVIDYAKLVQGIDLANDQGGAKGCMAGASDPECASIFQALGLDIATGGASSTPQTAFRLE